MCLSVLANCLLYAFAICVSEVILLSLFDTVKIMFMQCLYLLVAQYERKQPQCLQ